MIGFLEEVNDLSQALHHSTVQHRVINLIFRYIHTPEIAGLMLQMILEQFKGAVLL